MYITVRFGTEPTNDEHGNWRIGILSWRLVSDCSDSEWVNMAGRAHGHTTLGLEAEAEARKLLLLPCKDGCIHFFWLVGGSVSDRDNSTQRGGQRVDLNLNMNLNLKPELERSRRSGATCLDSRFIRDCDCGT